MIYIYTGMRASELLLIQKKDVDLSARIMVGGLKTQAGKNRRIPIHNAILPFVARLMQTLGESLVMFQQKSGKWRSIDYRTWFRDHWQPLMEMLGMTYTCHYTRHTCATMLREADVAEDLRKLILGHANGDITDRYTHHTDAMILAAIDRLPGRK